MSVSTKLSLRTVGNIVKNVFQNNSYTPTPLGRWKLCENKNINLVIDYSNEDHCGTCSRHTIIQNQARISTTQVFDDNEMFSYDYICLTANSPNK